MAENNMCEALKQVISGTLLAQSDEGIINLA